MPRLSAVLFFSRSKAFLGSEQALAPVLEMDSFTEGDWDKLPKSKGTVESELNLASLMRDFCRNNILRYYQYTINNK